MPILISLNISSRKAKTIPQDQIIYFTAPEALTRRSAPPSPACGRGYQTLLFVSQILSRAKIQFHNKVPKLLSPARREKATPPARCMFGVKRVGDEGG
jgi:hypothetical protein